jgi:hypothetical protein
MKKIILLVLILVGCGSAPVYQVDSDQWAVSQEELALARVSVTNFERVQGQLDSRHGGIVTFLYWKQELEPRGRVALAHGFLRQAVNMAGWGDFFAGMGYEVVIPNFIHSSLLGGNHDKNAQDLRDVADFLWPGQPRVYGGFSAGGLASIMAAATDRLAQGWFGLDPVDVNEMAKEPIKLLLTRNMPNLQFFAQASSCNAQLSFYKTWTQVVNSQSNVVLTTGTVHHAFENPYDPSIDSLCGKIIPRESVDALHAWLKVRLAIWLKALPQGRASERPLYF